MNNPKKIPGFLIWDDELPFKEEVVISNPNIINGIKNRYFVSITDEDFLDMHL